MGDKLEERIARLRRELAEAEIQHAARANKKGLNSSVQLTDLIDLDELQAIQDAFANATGVASIITMPDGTPITEPSNFSTLCKDIIRKTDKGLCNCMKSDAILGSYNPKGPTIQPCLSGGLWDGGASISVGGQHIANWLIGQIRNESTDQDRMLAYAKEIGADEQEFARALNRVTVMSLDQFKQIGEALYLFANLMSWTAYQNRLLIDNLSDLRKAHEDKAKLKSFLDNIIDSMPSSLVGIDSDGRVTHWNMQAAAVTGLGRKDVKGMLLVDALPNLAGEMDKILSVIRERKPASLNRLSEEVDGELHHNALSVYPLIANGSQGAVIRMDDITEQVRIEEMMIQSEKMLSVGGLAAGMAHEVNNPLAAILASAHLLKKRLLADTGKNRKVAESLGLTHDKIKEYIEQRGVESMLEAIIDSGQRAGNVVTNMLGFSRKSDGIILEVNPLDLLDKSVELVKSGHDLKHSYNFKDIEFLREYCNDPIRIACDANKLQQVFFNVLNNGAQAMTMAHKETGRAPSFILRGMRSGSFFRIEIEDNGPGMNPEIRKRIFEPFFTTKAPGVGTGLGLSVTYFIVTEVLEGTIEVTSRPGRGTKFIIKLPCTTQ